MRRELDLQRRITPGKATDFTFERGQIIEPPEPVSSAAPGRVAYSPSHKHPRTNRNTFLFILVPVLIIGIIYLALSTYRESAQNRRLNDEQNRLLAKLEEQAARTNKQVAELARSNEAVSTSLSLTTNLWNAYSNGVFLISGTYVLVDSASGRPLRLPQDAKGSALKSGEQIWLTPEGDGEIAKVDYEGTGFYVGDGYILSNRHIVAEPWSHDMWLQILSALVNGQPKLVRLQAFFPGQSRPYPLKFRLASSEYDLAVGMVNLGDRHREIPILPLDRSTDAPLVGQAVTTMGYPSGVDRLLAYLPETEARRLHERYGESGAALVGQLARRRLIRPLTSQGHIMDLHSNQIIYDGATAEGESGAPVFGSSGRVIGVHFGYFRGKDRISSLAVPIGRGLELLQRAGWKPAE